MRLRLPDALTRPNPRAPSDPHRIDAVAFDAEGTHLAIGARGRALVYRLRDGALVERYRTVYEESAPPGEPDPDAWSATEVAAVHLAPGGRHAVVVFAVYENNNDTYEYLEVFARDTGARAYVLFPESEADSGEDLPRGCTAVALSPDGALLAAASAEFGVGLWELATGRRIDGPLGQTELPTALQRELRCTGDLAFTSDGRRLVILTDDEPHILEYDLADRRCTDWGVVAPSGRGPRTAFDAGQFRLALTPGGETAVLLGRRGTFVFPGRSPRGGRFVPAPRVQRGMPVHLDANRMSALWVTATPDQAGALLRQDLASGRVRTIRWEPPRGERRQPLPKWRDDWIHDFPAAVSPDGTRVARRDEASVTVNRIRRVPVR